MATQGTEAESGSGSLDPRATCAPKPQPLGFLSWSVLGPRCWMVGRCTGDARRLLLRDANETTKPPDAGTPGTRTARPLSVPSRNYEKDNKSHLSLTLDKCQAQVQAPDGEFFTHFSQQSPELGTTLISVLLNGNLRGEVPPQATQRGSWDLQGDLSPGCHSSVWHCSVHFQQSLRWQGQSKHRCGAERAIILGGGGQISCFH